MNQKIALIIALILIAIGITKPDISNIINVRPVEVESLVIPPPANEQLLDKAKSVANSFASNSDRKTDGLRLASLYLDMATLIELDGSDQVIKNTEDIRQANRLVGPMLKLNIREKYPDLAETAQDLVVTSIGDDNVLLNGDLRSKAAEGFRALAWACNEGAK